jgi:hypothetical protein
MQLWTPSRRGYCPDEARAARLARKQRKDATSARVALVSAAIGTRWQSGEASGTIDADGASGMSDDELRAWLALPIGQSMSFGENTATRIR